MKKIILLFVVLILSFGTKAQNATVSKDGNFVAINHVMQGHDSATATGKTFTDSKGIVYPVWVSKNGKYFYFRTAKTSGNVYRAYIKVN